ncbi:SRPBCC family protein [Vulgatibacter incomptus]|uniref:Activator of Hsp90 ATPase homologue 1/2-like C-terminal domain-containing protein n=1 Tax=Vulgatibacter incomptus TaxID=1391653 RepID=A0A0K1PC59_9BACT|nr:SRPBCC family protein [Vulgatibacter incomptus]AKU91092.1 hypothetical protein AKJ08_1479 [Vulgatibacter incomptus]
MNQPSPAHELLVRKNITVAASPERAFEVFAREMGSWWPLPTHHIGAAEAVDVVVEPFAGGRWFERGADGIECDWGGVIAWEPPHRLLLAWELDAEWKHDPSVRSEVEVRFVPEGGGTRVELEHRKLSVFGERAAELRGILDSPGGWGGMLQEFAAKAR